MLAGAEITAAGFHYITAITKAQIDGLIAAGKAPDTPAAVISNGTTERQRTVVGRLEEIGELASSRVGGMVQALSLAPFKIDPVLIPTVLFGRHPGLGAPGDVTWGLGTWDDMDASVRVSTRA